MRIGSLRAMFPFLDRVQEKQDSSQSQQEGQHQQFQEKKETQTPHVEVNSQELESAIEAFSHEQSVQMTGLRAALVRSGPHLKVLLKDGSGAMIRQFTGEEFLQLREEAKKDARSRGKILDQKL